MTSLTHISMPVDPRLSRRRRWLLVAGVLQVLGLGVTLVDLARRPERVHAERLILPASGLLLIAVMLAPPRRRAAAWAVTGVSVVLAFVSLALVLRRTL